jgi:bacteriocin-like protein
MNNDIHELSIDELNAVSGGTWMDTVNCVTAAVRTMNDIQGVLGKAVDSIPPAPCHPK